jgi:hypothetical protein
MPIRDSPGSPAPRQAALAIRVGPDLRALRGLHVQRSIAPCPWGPPGVHPCARRHRLRFIRSRPPPRSPTEQIPHRRPHPPPALPASPKSLKRIIPLRATHTVAPRVHLVYAQARRARHARLEPDRASHRDGMQGGHESKHQARRYARTARTRRLCAASAGRPSCAGCGGRASRWCSGSARDDRRCRDRSNLRPHS